MKKKFRLFLEFIGIKKREVYVPESLIKIFEQVDKLSLTDNQKTELKQRLAKEKRLTGSRKKRRQTLRDLKKTNDRDNNK